MIHQFRGCVGHIAHDVKRALAHCGKFQLNGHPVMLDFCMNGVKWVRKCKSWTMQSKVLWFRLSPAVVNKV